MLENRKSVDQKVAKIRRRVMDLIAANAELFAQQGAVVESWRKHGGRRLGPYFRLAYRIDGRQRSIYLGTDVKLAKDICELLADLHAPRRKRQALSRMRESARKNLAKHKDRLRKELAEVGLYQKGNEFRGLRNLTHRCGLSELVPRGEHHGAVLPPGRFRPKPSQSSLPCHCRRICTQPG